MQDFVLLFFILLLIRSVMVGREVYHFTEHVTVIACAHYNRRHIDLVYVTRCLLLNLYSSSHYDVIAVKLVALLEESCACRHFKLVDGNV